MLSIQCVHVDNPVWKPDVVYRVSVHNAGYYVCGCFGFCSPELDLQHTHIHTCTLWLSTSKFIYFCVDLAILKTTIGFHLLRHIAMSLFKYRMPLCVQILLPCEKQQSESMCMYSACCICVCCRFFCSSIVRTRCSLSRLHSQCM